MLTYMEIGGEADKGQKMMMKWKMKTLMKLKWHLGHWLSSLGNHLFIFVYKNSIVQ